MNCHGEIQLLSLNFSLSEGCEVCVCVCVCACVCECVCVNLWLQNASEGLSNNDFHFVKVCACMVVSMSVIRSAICIK